jgi:hypothetical protein
MYYYIFILSTLLFFVLSPSILLNIAPKGSPKYIVALVHAIVFGGFLAVILKYYRVFFLHEYEGMWLLETMEGAEVSSAGVSSSADIKTACKQECLKKVKKKYDCNKKRSKCIKSYKKCKNENADIP